MTTIFVFSFKLVSFTLFGVINHEILESQKWPWKILSTEKSKEKLNPQKTMKNLSRSTASTLCIDKEHAHILLDIFSALKKIKCEITHKYYTQEE